MNSDAVTPLLIAWKIKESMMINCPINEFSKSLPNGWCHHNVSKLQSELGGKTVLGFLVIDVEDYIWCVPHSILQHDEQGYIDVTFNNSESIFFAPVVTYDSTKCHWILQHEYKIYKNKLFGIDWTMKGCPTKKLTARELMEIDFSSLVFRRDYLLSDTDSWIDYLDELNEIT